jgi:AcrR family transcriptional regulator
MALTRTPRSRWIDEGLRALAAAARTPPGSRRWRGPLRVTKGGFYWHFDDRRALLDTWGRVSIDEVIERVEGEGGDAMKTTRSTR